MKTTFKKLVLAFLCTISITAFAQKAEPVYSFVRVIHDFEWYQQQAKVWKNEIDNGTKNKMAWVYYFTANRMANACDSKKWESLKKDYFLPKEDIIKLAEIAIPNSFELFYMKIYDNSAGSEYGSGYILKAQKIKPYDTLLLPWLMNYYQFKNDKENIGIVSKKWFESNEMPIELLATAYDKLMSVDENGILLVNGDNDTYPFWILQNVQKIRTDVFVINVSLSLNDSYREAIFKENSIPPLTFKDNSERNMSGIVKHIIENIKTRPIYVSINMDPDIYKEYSDKMYMVGLAFRYSDKSFNNMAVLQNNVENKFLLDFLKTNFSNNYAQSVVDQSNLSYLAVFLKLYEQYNLSGETLKAQKIKELAKIVSSRSEYGTKWMQYFEK
jgi:hypothetical protein